ncbi:MAG TPA: hypothetical protein VFT72_06025 [Opitutaceae bacterium]|nr:hypothetical protein [Opitutaceae bacterium]
MTHNSHRLSFALNIILLATAVILALPKSQPAATAPITTTKPKETVIISEHALPHYTETDSTSNKRRWLVDQLREMGVPNHILAQVVLANLDAEWTKHAAEVTIKTHGDSDTMAALQLDIDKSLDSEMRAALGEEGFRQWDRDNMMREANAGNVAFTASEAESAYGLWKKYQARELALKEARVKRTMDEADVAEAQGAALAEFNQQMKGLLGDERYARSQQTDPDTAAAGLREEFAQANPNESQFQDLLKTQKQLNEQRAALENQFQTDKSSMVYTAQLKALEDARDREYERVLGPQVFDTLQKTKDPGYNQMKKNQALWGLDDRSIDGVYGTVQYYQKTVQEYEAQTHAREAQGQSVNWDAVNQSLEQFTEQTRQSLRRDLGEERFNQLDRNNVFRFNEIAHR